MDQRTLKSLSGEVTLSKVRAPLSPSGESRASGPLGLEEHVSVETPFPLDCHGGSLRLLDRCGSVLSYSGSGLPQYNLMLPVESADVLAAEAIPALDSSLQTAADEILVFSLDSAPLLFWPSPSVSVIVSWISSGFLFVVRVSIMVPLFVPIRVIFQPTVGTVTRTSLSRLGVKNTSLTSWVCDNAE